MEIRIEYSKRSEAGRYAGRSDAAATDGWGTTNAGITETGRAIAPAATTSSS